MDASSPVRGCLRPWRLFDNHGPAEYFACFSLCQYRTTEQTSAFLDAGWMASDLSCRKGYSEDMKRVGILVGREKTFPDAIINGINERGRGEVMAEYIKLGGVRHDSPPQY